MTLVATEATRDVNDYHHQLGHPNESITRATAKARPCQGFWYKADGKETKNATQVSESKQASLSNPRRFLRGEKKRLL